MSLSRVFFNLFKPKKQEPVLIDLNSQLINYSNESVGELIESLKNQPGPIILDLSNNQLGRDKKNIDYLNHLLENNKNIVSLSLAGNLIDSDSLAKLSHSIGQSPKLASINFENNLINDSGVENLERTLGITGNTTLTSCSLLHNNILKLKNHFLIEKKTHSNKLRHDVTIRCSKKPG